MFTQPPASRKKLTAEPSKVALQLELMLTFAVAWKSEIASEGFVARVQSRIFAIHSAALASAVVYSAGLAFMRMSFPDAAFSVVVNE